MALQEPRAVRLDASWANDDATLARFIAQEAGQMNYFLVQIGCSFRPADDETFVRAQLSVPLRRADGQADAGPIAYSMQPREICQQVEFTSTITVGADAKLLGTGVATGGEEETKVTRQEPFLIAYEEGGPNPSWEFRRQDGRAILGSYWLNLVVRAVAGSVTAVRVRVALTIDRKRWGVLPYQVREPDARTLDFTIE